MLANRKCPEELGARRSKSTEAHDCAPTATGGTLFEEMGFYYVGPIDGHDLNHAVARPEERARREEIRTRSWSTSSHKKGKGYGAGRRTPPTSTTASIKLQRDHRRTRSRPRPGAPSYTRGVRRQSLIEEARKRRQDRRRHRGDAGREPASMLFGAANSPSARSTSASPSSMR